MSNYGSKIYMYDLPNKHTMIAENFTYLNCVPADYKHVIKIVCMYANEIMCKSMPNTEL